MAAPQLLASPRADSFQPPAVQYRRDHVGPAADLDALRCQRRQQRHGHPPWIDRRLLGGVDAAVEGRGEAGLQLAAAARRQPLGDEAKRALQVVHAAQLRRLVAIEGDVEGTVTGIAAAQLARRLELGDEVRIDPGSGDRHSQQLGLAESKLADRRQHPGSDAGGAGRWLGAIEHDGPGAALGKPPGAAEADGSASNNDHVIGASVAQAFASAGITRIRSRRSVASLPPSQPLRLPYSTDATPRTHNFRGCHKIRGTNKIVTS